MTLATAAPTRPSAEPRSRPEVQPRRRVEHRLDIDGLRAVAVGLVVTFHAGVGAVSGGFVGVDVFFVISGFLITGLLVGELQQTGTVSLSRFYARRIRRLLPLSALVLVATAVAVAAWWPPLTYDAVRTDITAAALYVANWHFAAGSTEYMAVTDHSPALHYWSLSVEEQFYVVWPLLLLGLAWACRRAGDGAAGPLAGEAWQRMRRWLTFGLAGLVGGSFLLSWATSASSGPWAYFGLHTRAWELGAGAALALAIAAVRRWPVAVAGVAGWIGIGLIVWSACSFDRTTVMPGVAALLPVGGTVLVLAAGAREGALGLPVMLGRPALRYVGRISYGWYLWHWPCLVLAAHWAPRTAADGTADLSTPRPPAALLAVVLSFGLAALTHRILEEPIRRSPVLARQVPLTLLLGAALTITSVTLPGSLLGGREAGAAETLPSGTVTTVSTPSGTSDTVTYVLSPLQARNNFFRGNARCLVNGASVPQGCVFGDPQGTTKVAVVGDSHADHWMPAFDKVGKKRGWAVTEIAKAGCPFVPTPVQKVAYSRPDTDCTQWTQAALQRLKDDGPWDLVVVVHSQGYAKKMLDGDELAAPERIGPLWKAATAELVTELSDSARKLVFVRDTPWSEVPVADCVSQHLADSTACDFDPTESEERAAVLVAAEEAAGIAHIDPTAVVCPALPCAAVDENGVIKFRDNHHLTATYARSLAPWVYGSLEQYLPST